jgi:hypothetical protein
MACIDRDRLSAEGSDCNTRLDLAQAAANLCEGLAQLGRDVVFQLGAIGQPIPPQDGLGLRFD